MLAVDRIFYTCDDLVKEFPNKWIVVEDAELTDTGLIKSGKLICVCEDFLSSMKNRVCCIEVDVHIMSREVNLPDSL